MHYLRFLYIYNAVFCLVWLVSFGVLIGGGYKFDFGQIMWIGFYNVMFVLSHFFYIKCNACNQRLLESGSVGFMGVYKDIKNCNSCGQAMVYKIKPLAYVLFTFANFFVFAYFYYFGKSIINYVVSHFEVFKHEEYYKALILFFYFTVSLLFFVANSNIFKFFLLKKLR